MFLFGGVGGAIVFVRVSPGLSVLEEAPDETGGFDDGSELGVLFEFNSFLLYGFFIPIFFVYSPP